MKALSRIAAWGLDYGYVAYWQIRHAIGSASAASLRSGERAPVLLLPGVFETWHFLRPAAIRLHERGHPVHAIDGFGYNRNSIHHQAQLAADYLDRHDLHDVVVLAHSKGGLIGKHLMLLNDPEHRVRHMVAVNTPFAGSSYARYLPGRTLREFRPTAQTLAALAADASVNSRITSVASEFDPHIPAGSRLEGAVNVTIPIGGHFRILGSTALVEVVEAAVTP